MRINVLLRLVDFFNDSCLALVLGSVRRWQSIGLVRSLGSPGNIVPVTVRIDIEDVDIGRGDEHILWEGVEHVPWVEVHERGQEV